MREQGILRSWNDERGFGFIAPVRGGPELFVHVSELPRDGTRPVAGESVSYELGRGRDGRPQALRVMRTAIGTTPGVTGARRKSAPAAPATRAAPSAARGFGRGGRWLTLLLLCIAAAWGWTRWEARSPRQAPAAQPLEAVPLPQPARESPLSPPVPVPDAGAQPWRCDGRTRCSQMSSCAEATWFLQHCPGTQMDGDHDGVPCEQQWCAGAGGR